MNNSSISGLSISMVPEFELIFLTLFALFMVFAFSQNFHFDYYRITIRLNSFRHILQILIREFSGFLSQKLP
jgi:hypothetical protein